MRDARSVDLAPLLSDRTALLGYLGQPFLWAYGAFLAVMVGLSVAIPGFQSLCMSARWPMLGVVAALGLLLPLVSRGRAWTAAQGCLALFVVALACSTLYSSDRSYTFQRAASVGMLFAATFIGLYTFARDWRQATRTTDLLWCIGAVLVVTGFVFRAQSGATPGGSAERFEGLHSRATGAGSYAALFLPIAVYQASRRLRGAWAVFGWGVTGLFLLQMALAGARAAFVLGVAVALALGFAYYGRRAALALLVAAFLAPAPFLLDPGRLDKLKERSDRLVRSESFGTFTGRLDRWKFGLEQFLRKPAFGFGFGASRTLASAEDPTRFKLGPDEVFNLHSDQIEALMDVGLVGYAPFAAFWLCLIVAGFRAMAALDSRQRDLALAYGGAVFYAFADTFLHGGFLAAGGGVSAFSWTMAAMFLATLPHRPLAPRLSFEPGPAAAAAIVPRPRLRLAPALPSARRLARREG